MDNKSRLLKLAKEHNIVGFSILYEDENQKTTEEDAIKVIERCGELVDKYSFPASMYKFLK